MASIRFATFLEIMSEFDFFAAFMDFDILKAEAVSTIVGKITATLFNSMIENGLSEENAHKIINDAFNVFVYQTFHSYK